MRVNISFAAKETISKMKNGLKIRKQLAKQRNGLQNERKFANYTSDRNVNI